MTYVQQSNTTEKMKHKNKFNSITTKYSQCKTAHFPTRLGWRCSWSEAVVAFDCTAIWVLFLVLLVLTDTLSLCVHKIHSSCHHLLLQQVPTSTDGLKCRSVQLRLWNSIAISTSNPIGALPLTILSVKVPTVCKVRKICHLWWLRFSLSIWW